MTSNLHIEPHVLASFCKRQRISKLSFFGSVLRADFVPSQSDVDVLIEFEDGVAPSLFMLSKVQFELEHLLKHRVDLCRPVDLNQYIRHQVLTQAQVQYVAA